ncbi:uncharacterized protein METZ01_LOCUS471757, partial [marine metagenome]
MFWKTCVAVVVTFFVASCTGLSLENRLNRALNLSGGAGFKFTEIQTRF